MPSRAPGSDMATLLGASRGLRELIDHAIAAGPSRSIRLLGRGMGEISQGFAQLERQVGRSIWNMQPSLYYDPEDHSRELDRKSRQRGVDLQMRVPKRVITQHPLLPSLSPGLRLAPVQFRLLIADARIFVADGPRTTAGDATAWISDDPALVRRAVDFWEIVETCSEPAPPVGGGTLLTERQLDIAEAMCLGLKDSVIARRCDVSLRTLEREVATILNQLGVRSRAEGILTMLGRGRNSQVGDPARTSHGR
ncbi:MAG: response regulator transcription factor [Nocardioides sp.]